MTWGSTGLSRYEASPMFRQHDTPVPAHSGLIAFAGLADCRVSLATFEVTLLNRDERV